MNNNYRVVFVQQHLTHYREEFLERTKNRLLGYGVEFNFVHSLPDSISSNKNDSGYLSWARIAHPIIFNIFGVKFVWLNLPHDLRNADLIILTQENKLIANYYWILRRFFTSVRIAFFGHGRNFQSKYPNGIKERWKKLFVGAVDWWFAYTQKTRGILLSDGYPEGRITAINNAIDNESFQQHISSVTDNELSLLRETLGLFDSGSPSPIGLFCGSLYSDKRVDFMLAAADKIKMCIPGFCLVVIGDGPSLSDVKAAAQSRPWLHAVGAKKGREKAAWFKLASVIFNPGAVGLHVLDSFAAGVPLATTADAKHGPEIAYLENGINGLITPGTVDEYSDAVIKLLEDKFLYQGVRKAGLDASALYTLDSMVDNFVSGIVQCLQLPKKN